MHRPTIGIPLSLDDRGRWRDGRSYFYIDCGYADAIARAGGSAIQLPIQNDVESLIASLDGLLIPGGDDFPAEDELPEDASLDLTSARQLAFDESLFETATGRGIPILGICYGMQLMARARGGALHAHLPSARPDAQNHKLPPDARHEISIEGSSQLANILESQRIQVNSLHHQALRSVGNVYLDVAQSPDGVIEAIERPAEDARPVWELGVQWHPEKMADHSSDLLFKSFVDACRRFGSAA